MADERLFIHQTTTRKPGWRDFFVLALVITIAYFGVLLAVKSPEVIEGREISLALSKLPLYAGYSLGRMFAAYLLSMGFTLVYGYIAAYNRRAERVMIPILDVLQSVPILSFLPLVLLSLHAFLPEGTAAEIASIVLIFTSQVWNLTFAWYQSLTTIPKELREANRIYQFNFWLRFKALEAPFAAISLIWNSMMSWAGGWFFLMAAEIFTVGNKDFRLPGLGAYLHEAATQGNTPAILWGVATLVLLIILLDQLIWRPLLAWSDKLKVEMVSSDQPINSWFYRVLNGSVFVSAIERLVSRPLSEAIDHWMIRRFPFQADWLPDDQTPTVAGRIVWAAFLTGLAYGGIRVIGMLSGIPLAEWILIGAGLGATLLRVVITLLLAFIWTLPVGVLIGSNQKLASWLQPLVQIVASIPATALFPVFALIFLRLPGGLNLSSIVLMLMGTQWYLLFNIIAGASAIPRDLKFTATLLGFRRSDRWRVLTIPALFPYMITGAITASGGAWNASIVAEYIHFGGQTHQITGIGALIAHATAAGDYALLLAATLSMILAVVMINRLVWNRLYRLAEEKYRME